jgi:hypothetical protein
MRVNNKPSAQQQRESAASQQEITEVGDDRHMPRKLTFAENAILTVKVLLGAGSVLIALWSLNLWTSPN